MGEVGADHSDVDVVAVAGVQVPQALPASPPRPATGTEIAQFVALRAAACVGADYSNLAILNRSDPSTLRLFHGTFLEPAMADRYTDIDVNAPYPIAAAIRTGHVVVLEGEDAYRRSFPEIWADTHSAGIEATVSIPLTRGDGSPIGAIGFAWAVSPAFDMRLEKALEAVAHLVIEIVERAELFEAEHQLIVDLHLRLLSALPTVDGLSTAARYIPAGQPDSIGGDWFEGLRLDGDKTALVVGDVTGHGLSAAADMALIRGMITALLLDDVAVGDVFGRVSNVLHRRPEGMLATAALAVIDLADSTLTYSTAGHPSPIMISPAGDVTILDSANAPIMGVSMTAQVSATIPFPSGSTLVMYTDGLVERRDRIFYDGMLAAVDLLAVASADMNPDQMIDYLLSGLVDRAVANDDIAVVVARNVSV